eukprot:scaffold9553_cov114-Isochrysis_galbana.AAC.9
MEVRSAVVASLAASLSIICMCKFYYLVVCKRTRAQPSATLSGPGKVFTMLHYCLLSACSV